MQADSILNILSDSHLLADSSSFIESDSLNQKPSSFISESSVNNFTISAREKQSGDWVTFLLLLGFILIASSKFLYRKRFNELFKAFWARNYSNQLMREGNIFKEQFGLVMFIHYLISIPLFYALSIKYLLPNIEMKLSLWLVIQLAVIPPILWSVRFLFVKITAIIFNTPKPSAEILTQLFIFNLLSGVAVLPFTTLFYYSGIPAFIITGIIIWVFMQIYRFIRLFVVGFSYSIFSGLHLFLYLCTLEILPIVILLKVLSSFNQ